MKVGKSAVWVLAASLLLVVFGIWYVATYSMRSASEYEINRDITEKRLLVVTQKSAYKDALTIGIEAELADLPVGIKMVDLVSLKLPLESPPTACILMHTWEFWEPVDEAIALKNALADEVPLFIVSTSGSGEEFLDGEFDGISSASELTDIEQDINSAALWAKSVLGLEHQTMPETNMKREE